MSFEPSCKRRAFYGFPFNVSIMDRWYGRPTPSNSILPSFLDEAGSLARFVPPFRFTSFFSPEDTLLCTIASGAALSDLRWDRSFREDSIDETLRIAELTTGSGLVGLHALLLEPSSELAGFDVDPSAVTTAATNSAMLGLEDRACFACADLWADETVNMLEEFKPRLMICNPPYVPEPPQRLLEREAGAGPDGTAHLKRTLEIADRIQPQSIALSWCSLSDPAEIVASAQSIGYALDSLYIVVIADGEYSGSVHHYLRGLSTAFINEDADTIDTIASDGAARFAYLLMAGSFSRRDPIASADAADAVRRICNEFSSKGLNALVKPETPLPVKSWLLDRWDEVRLRAFLHGDSGERGRV